jgi:hypothetical protein
MEENHIDKIILKLEVTRGIKQRETEDDINQGETRHSALIFEDANDGTEYFALVSPASH